MSDAKKNEEIWQIERFKENLSDFPEGDIIPGEEPDFIIESDAGKIGLELTKYYTGQKAANGRVLQEQESLQEKIVAKAKKTFEASGGNSKLLVVVNFGETNLTKRDITPVADKIAEAVNSVLSDPSSVGKRFIDIGGWEWESQKLLPPEVKMIQITIYDKATKGDWRISVTDTIGDASVETIQNIINKKNALYPEYIKKCDRAYLVITAENVKTSESADISEELIETVFTSKFERVFVFQIFERRITELRVKP